MTWMFSYGVQKCSELCAKLRLGTSPKRRVMLNSDVFGKAEYASSYVSVKKREEAFQAFRRKLKEGRQVSVGDWVLYWYNSDLGAYFGSLPKGVPLQVIYVNPNGCFYSVKSSAGVVYTVDVMEAAMGRIFRLAGEQLSVVRHLWSLTQAQRVEMLRAIKTCTNELREQVDFAKLSSMVSMALGRSCSCYGLSRQELWVLAAIIWYGENKDERLNQYLDYVR